MIRPNPHFAKLSEGYLFSRVEKEVQKLKQKDPCLSFFNLGIGDVTLPLASSVVKEILESTQALEKEPKGYGPSQGYSFLRKWIAEKDYKNVFSEEEIFIGNGTKCQLAQLSFLFHQETKVALSDPSYPVYIDTNVLAGRSGPLEKGQYAFFTYLPLTEENEFTPIPPQHPVDLIYLCSPNNPTGTSLSKEKIKKWIDYAKENKALILWDGAYADFITSQSPKSVYEVEGAKEVCIELRSFSKRAGFTGLRVSYCVIPKELTLDKAPLFSVFNRLVDTQFGGVPYILQKAAASVYSEEGEKQIKAQIQEYQSRACFLREGLSSLGFSSWGGEDSPFLWVKTPSSQTSWEFFHYLLEKARIISIPGSGFGQKGEGFVRFSSFAPFPVLKEAIYQLQKLNICALS